MNTNAHSRRTVLGTIAGAIAGLAGCTGRTPSLDSSDAIEGASADGFTLTVSLNEPAKVDRVVIISPSGSEFDSKSVATGVTLVEFDVGMNYELGVYEVVATQDGSEVERTTIEIRPEIQIRRIEIGENANENVPENLPYGEEQVLVVVENIGTGPDAVTDLTISGGVPNPTESDTKRHSGIFDQSDNYGAATQVPIPAGEKVSLWSTTKPFLFTGDGVECGPEAQQYEAELELGVKLSAGIVRGFELSYTASEGSDECEISISE